MAQSNLFDRASRYLGCHPGAELIVTDAWEINPNHHECEVMCGQCTRSVCFDISRPEYRHMDSRKPFTLKREGEQ